MKTSAQISPRSMPLLQGIDILEESLRTLDKKLLDIMLFDRTTRRNILWATTDYSAYGEGFEETSEILPRLVTGQYAALIQPRITKSQDTQAGRTRNHAEVFTPSWICNEQNNLVDEQWFGRADVFNRTTGNTWAATTEPIAFPNAKKSWKKYVDTPRLEISCGEAPYLVSRYDTVTGEKIPLAQRIGLLDRKMRVVGENSESDEEWLTWAQRAFESVYGFEYQGDNLLLARENLLYSYIEYYFARFQQAPDILLLRKIARIISWNIWQMDGLKGVVPGSCRPIVTQLYSMLGVDRFEEPCPGCAKDNIRAHTGVYCKIHDWRSNSTHTFVSLLKGGCDHGGL